MKMSEALAIIMERRGIKSLPASSTERYPLILEAWDLYRENQAINQAESHGSLENFEVSS